MHLKARDLGDLSKLTDDSHKEANGVRLRGAE